jgi:hypothetical protein
MRGLLMLESQVPTETPLHIRRLHPVHCLVSQINLALTCSRLSNHSEGGLNVCPRFCYCTRPVKDVSVNQSSPSQSKLGDLPFFAFLSLSSPSNNSSTPTYINLTCTYFISFDAAIQLRSSTRRSISTAKIALSHPRLLLELPPYDHPACCLIPRQLHFTPVDHHHETSITTSAVRVGILLL